MAGPPRCLGAALWRHCPSHKRSKVDGTIPRIAKQPRRRSWLGRLQKSCTSSARLPCQISRPGKISFLPGWNLCGDIPAAWGLVEALPLPQTKQSRWHNSTHGLAKQPGVDLGLDVPKKAALPNQPSACLVGLPPACLEKSRIYLAGTCVAGPPRCRRPCGGTAPPTNVPHMILRSSLGVDLGLDFLKRLGWTSPCLEKSRTYLAGTCVAGPPRCLGAALWRHCPSHKRSKVDGTIPRIAKQPRRRSRLGRHQKSCTSSARLPCQITGLEKSRSYLPLPQTKQSRWHNSTRGLALGRPQKACTSLTPCKAALPNQPFACLVGLPTAPCLEKSRTYLARACFPEPRCLDLVEALPLPQTKQSRWNAWACEAAQASISASMFPKYLPARLPCQISPLIACLDFPLPGKISYLPVDGTIPRVCLRSSSAWTSPKTLTPCKAALPNQPSACLVGLPRAWNNLVLTWLELVWLDLPAACGLWRHCPSHKRSTHDLAKQPRPRSRLGLPQKAACLPLLGGGLALISAWTSPTSSLTPCKEPSACLVGLPCVAGPPRCLGAALSRHCPSHKRSKVDGTIPRMATQHLQLHYLLYEMGQDIHQLAHLSLAELQSLTTTLDKFHNAKMTGQPWATQHYHFNGKEQQGSP